MQGFLMHGVNNAKRKLAYLSLISACNIVPYEKFDFDIVGSAFA